MYPDRARPAFEIGDHVRVVTNANPHATYTIVSIDTSERPWQVIIRDHETGHPCVCNYYEIRPK